MSIKSVVLLDVDGVIANFSLEYWQLAKKITGRPLPGPEEWTDWDMKKTLSLTEQEVRYVHTFLNRDGVAQHLQPYAGAIKGVSELMKVCDLYFLTSPIETSQTWMHDRTMWLVSKFGLDQGRKVIHTYYKYLVKGDFFIDDKPANVRAWQKDNPDGRAYLWDQPFNRGEVHEGLLRMSSWSGLRDAVERV